MKCWMAILLTIGLVLACFAATEFSGTNPTSMMIFGTSLWVAVDSSRIGLKRYKSGIAYGPVLLFFACMMLWIVGFPWYLTTRHNIKTGKAVLKDEVQASAAGEQHVHL
jgi:hypothetical protein